MMAADGMIQERSLALRQAGAEIAPDFKSPEQTRAEAQILAEQDAVRRHAEVVDAQNGLGYAAEAGYIVLRCAAIATGIIAVCLGVSWAGKKLFGGDS